MREASAAGIAAVAGWSDHRRMTDEIRTRFEGVVRRTRQLVEKDGGAWSLEVWCRRWSEVLEGLRREPEFVEAVRVLEADPDVSGRLGKPIFTEHGTRQAFDAASVVTDFVYECAPSGRGFEEAFDLFMRYLRDGRVSLELFARVDHLNNPEPLEFTVGELTIRQMPDARFAVRALFEIDTFRQEKAPKVEKSDAFNNACIAKLGTVVDLLHLQSANQRVSIPMVTIRTVFPLAGVKVGTGSSLIPYTISTLPPGMLLRPADVVAVQRRHDVIRNAPANQARKFRAVLHRFGLSRHETDSDERVADLVSAGEALLLDGDLGDLKYKFALRAAFFIDRTHDESQKELFEVMQRAYVVRSKVAHGGAAEPKYRRGLKDEQLSPYHFANLIEGLLRRAITKAIDVGLPPERSDGKFDWESLMWHQTPREEPTR